MNFKSIFILFLMIIWTIVCWNYYTCNIKHQYCLHDNDHITEISKISDTESLYFGFNSDSAILNHWEHTRDSICQLSTSKKLDIVGYYYNDEKNTTSYSNLGLARAHRIADLLKSCLDSSQLISFSSQKIDTTFSYPYRKSHEINILQNSFDPKSSELQIIDNHGKLEFHFPSNSTKEIKSASLDSVLKGVISSSNGKKIQLTGHTDNIGLEEKNIHLSTERCQSIKRQLIRLGAIDSTIICVGKGSSEPIVPNTTEDNRALNRRVDLIIE